MKTTILIKRIFCLIRESNSGIIGFVSKYNSHPLVLSFFMNGRKYQEMNEMNDVPGGDMQKVNEEDVVGLE